MTNRKKHLVAIALFLAASTGGGIVHAEDSQGTLDVTGVVQQAVQDNALDVVANNDLGADPAPTNIKKLRVDYTLDGKAESKAVMEYAKLSIHPSKGVKLVVTKAVYGDLPDTRKVDVTAVLSEAVQADKMSLYVINESMHADPAPGTGKTLEIKYTVGGKAHETTVGEGETLTLPQPTDGKGSLVIVSATYGAS